MCSFLHSECWCHVSDHSFLICNSSNKKEPFQLQKSREDKKNAVYSLFSAAVEFHTKERLLWTSSHQSASVENGKKMHTPEEDKCQKLPEIDDFLNTPPLPPDKATGKGTLNW